MFCPVSYDFRTGKQGRANEKDKHDAITDVSEKWVQRLPLLYNPGPHVTFDKCLVAFRCEELLIKKVTMLGTKRKNKPKFPSDFLAVKNKKVTSSGNSILLLPQEREKCPAAQHNVQRCCPEHQGRQKMQMVIDYNEIKGRVDNLDKVTATFSCQ